MKIALQVNGRIREVLGRKGVAIQDGSNAAVVRQTDETKGAMRVQIAQRLSVRASNALRSRFYNNDPNSSTGSANTVGFIHSRWFRKSKANGQNIDMFKAFETGAVIRPVKGRSLAIPLKEAYNVVGRGRRKPTPTSVQTALGIKLFQFTSKKGNVFLAITKESGPVALSRGRTRKIKPVRFIKSTRDRSFPTTRRGFRVKEPILLFLLLRGTRLPKRLDFGSVRTQARDRLRDKVRVELARRGATG